MTVKRRRPNVPRPLPKPDPKIRHEAMRARFVDEYMADPQQNATQAAIRAGYSPKGAHVAGSRLLRDPNIRAEIARRQQMQSETVQRQAMDRYEVNADRVVRELAKLAFSNMADYIAIDANGHALLDLSAINFDQAAAIQSVETRRTTRTVGEGEAAVTTETVDTKIKTASKREALVDLGKHLGVFKDGVDVTVPVRFIVERTERSDARMKRQAEGGY